MTQSKIKNILVTGGGGFLGKRICHKLKEKKYHVISLSRKKYLDLETKGIESRQCDITNEKDLIHALNNVDAVIHTAAQAGIWGDPRSFYQNNVVGTQNILKACHANQIKYLIYTSSPSVVFERSDLLGEDESTPYAKNHLCVYSQTKTIAEKLVLEATKQSGLKTSCLRPHLIWGPGDPHFLPRLIQKAKARKLFQVGKGTNLVDVIYVDNAARAHIDILENLFCSDKTRGQAYFIGQERPVNLWVFLNQLLRACHLKPINKKIPYSLAYLLGTLSESYYKLFRIYHKEPQMTPFLALQLAKSHYFSHKKAQKDFAYHIEVPIEKGLENLEKSLF